MRGIPGYRPRHTRRLPLDEAHETFACFGKQLAHSLPGELGERARLAPQGALQKDRLAQHRHQIERASSSPCFGAYRVSSDGATEVDEQQLERGRADDAIVQLGIAVREPPLLQSHELRKRLFGQEPQAGRRRERKFLGQADVRLGRLDTEGGDAGVGLPGEEAAAEDVRACSRWAGGLGDLAGEGVACELLLGVAVELSGKIRLAKMERVGRRKG